jgi:hypothetical protein
MTGIFIGRGSQGNAISNLLGSDFLSSAPAHKASSPPTASPPPPTGQPTQIAAGSDGVACGFIRWTLPEDAPPMLAIVRCSFEVDFGEWQVSTEPITLVLQSREGVLESVGKEDSVVARDQAEEIVKMLSAIPGRKSDGFKSLLRQLEATTTSPSTPKNSAP